ncbi:hypothetical protein H8K47_11395 [Undibacterium sp. CY7W]|uniref:Uncharacterized protein n=1 Tax=Undibacterium rugosum TaxID=2762291 RepID=A0A923I3R1_9BURK|nr:hypothetical protein [Undibacterium rugosum]MBC3935967.1 hypothetical protein [Undibacterium rugosum]
MQTFAKFPKAINKKQSKQGNFNPKFIVQRTKKHPLNTDTLHIADNINFRSRKKTNQRARQRLSPEVPQPRVTQSFSPAT